LTALIGIPQLELQHEISAREGVPVQGGAVPLPIWADGIEHNPVCGRAVARGFAIIGVYRLRLWRAKTSSFQTPGAPPPHRQMRGQGSKGYSFGVKLVGAKVKEQDMLEKLKP
jgi:hypothetical protein